MREQETARKYWDGKSKHRIPSEKVIHAFANAKISFLKKNIPDLKKLKTLEAGCGDGYISRFMEKETDLLGIDISKGMLAKNPANKKIMGSAYDLPFGDNSFDLVMESNMLHHLARPLDCVTELKRVAKNYVFLSEPNARSWAIYISHYIDPDERQCCDYNLKFLERFLNDAGMETVAKKNYGRVPPNKARPFMLPFLIWLEKNLPGGYFSMALGKIS